MNKWLKVGIIAAAVVIGVPTIAYASLSVYCDIANPFFRVSVSSMEPSLHMNDLILVSHRETLGSLKVGDIILYHLDGQDGKIIIQRIVEIRTDAQNKTIVRTDSDVHAGLPSNNLVTEDKYIGKVVSVVFRGR